jgi:superfamily II DNA or RNA helicase
MRIIVNNNRCKLVGHVSLILKLREHPAFCIRSKGAFFAPAFQKGIWDGRIRFISESGTFDTGMLPKIIDVLEGIISESKKFKGEKIKLIDEREPIIPKKVPTILGDSELRDYQREAIIALKRNKVKKLPFPRGIIAGATNFGKTITAAGIHATYGKKTLLLLNSKDLFRDAIKTIPKYLPGQVGILASGHDTEWNDFMIVMVPTAYKRLKELKQIFPKYEVVLVDEGDLATSKTYKSVLNETYNSYVRIALTGTAMVDKRQKVKNERLRSTFGNIIHQTKNIELIKKGVSSDVRVLIHKGNRTVKEPRNYDYEYELGIIKNKERNKKIVNVAIQDVKDDALPMLIITKNHAHVNRLFKRIKKLSDIVGHEFFGLKIDWVHHKRKDRQEVIEKFETGKLDILVGSYILKRGKNFPLMCSVNHAGAGDSMAGVLQILGRATRKHEVKKFTRVHDYDDEGAYLKSHSKHRIITYKNEQLKVTIK